MDRATINTSCCLISSLAVAVYHHFLISCHAGTCLFYDISINIRATGSLKSSLVPSVHFCHKANALEGVLEKRLAYVIFFFFPLTLSKHAVICSLGICDAGGGLYAVNIFVTLTFHRAVTLLCYCFLSSLLLS